MDKTYHPVTSAYVFDRPNLVFNDRDACHLNQLNWSFGLIKDGKASGDHWQHIDDYKAFVARHSHILPAISVGGWGADGFSQACSADDTRAVLVQSILDLMQEHGFLGVDIDWEYPASDEAGIAASPDDRENFTKLMQELRDGLDVLTKQDGKKRLLACALGGSSKLIKGIDCPAIGRIVDQVNLMSYDIQTPWVNSHHTPLFSNEGYPYSAAHAVEIFAEVGIPKEKMMIGSAHYGKLYTMKEDTVNPLFQPAASDGYNPRSYTKLQPILEKAELYFDDVAKAPYAIADGSTFITYENPVSIHHKGQYVLDNHLMGMMCWEYGEDVSGELLRAMYESMN